MDYMPHDLDQLLHLAKYQTILEPSHVKTIFFNIANGLKQLHDAGIMHRDLKPQNILIDNNCSIQITDFGLSRKIPKKKR